MSKEKYANRTETEILKLQLPGLDEPADVTVLNDNFTILDSLGKMINSDMNNFVFHPQQQNSVYPNACKGELSNYKYDVKNFINPDPNIYNKVLITFWSLNYGVCTPLTVICENLNRTDSTTIGFIGTSCQEYKAALEGSTECVVSDYMGRIVRYPYKAEDNSQQVAKSLTIVLYHPTPWYARPSIYAKALWLK